MALGEFISKNKKPIMIIGGIVVVYFGYKYVAQQMKNKKDQQNMINADINALNNAPVVPVTPSGGFWNTVTFGLL